MAALTTNKQYQSQDIGSKSYPVKASTTIYKGGNVCIDSTGYAVPAADAADYKFVGVSKVNVDNSSGSNGDLWVTCQDNHNVRYACTCMGQTNIGELCYVLDDQIVGLANTSNYLILVGRIVKYISTTEVEVDIAYGIRNDTPWEYVRMFFAGAVGASSIQLANSNRKYACYIKGVRLSAATAPGGSRTCTLTVATSTSSVVLELVYTAKSNENYGLSTNLPLPADSPLKVSIQDDAASGLTANVAIDVRLVRKTA